MLGTINKANSVPIHLVTFNHYDYPPRTPWVEELHNDDSTEQGKEEGSSA
jgi:hypothetical protein